MCIQIVKQKKIAIAGLGKKLSFIRKFAINLSQGVHHFHRVKELFKSVQTGYGVYHGYIECKTKRIFGRACLGKKLASHREICH